MTVLIDTNIIVAALNAEDARHQEARKLLGGLMKTPRLVVAPVLVEVFFLIAAHYNYDRALQVLSLVLRGFEIVPLLLEDMQRMLDLMTQYRDARFDYTDAAIMAVAERMKVQRIATFDRRDFEIYRPLHAVHFELLP